MLKKAFIAFSLGLVAFLVIGFLLPSEYLVRRTIQINLPPETVFPYLNDLRNWPKWSVWVEREPSMEITFGQKTSDVGASYSWKSKNQGSGELSFTEVIPNQVIRFDLHITDWESHSDGVIRVDRINGGSKVIWSDAGKLTWNPIMRIMGRFFFDDWIGKDFETSLEKLKNLLEKKP